VQAEGDFVSRTALESLVVVREHLEREDVNLNPDRRATLCLVVEAYLYKIGGKLEVESQRAYVEYSSWLATYYQRVGREYVHEHGSKTKVRCDG